MKAGIVYSDAINTVSPTYAREIQTREYGWGLDGFCAAAAGLKRDSQWRGLLALEPGIGSLSRGALFQSGSSGKRICKRALLSEFGLTQREALDRPLIGMVTRLAGQKGADLMPR